MPVVKGLSAVQSTTKCKESNQNRIRSSLKKWWALTGSNRRHPPCKGGALPAELNAHFVKSL